ncbi:hypothetical protein [Escherichia phage MLP2]|uniref:Uncharacterized protein n=2 Tax=Tequatrovirus TaxID=10663 RepID=A0A193GZX7_9CAUD|nr:hypothetical protein BH804_gp159 [Shigella phage SHFML-11]YP_009278972.1 hypothetical protein BI057_gp074 [Shigella phage SHFML-26]UEN68648.1 hypothetical protein [Escherichia phage MLP2]URP85215.1 hypothetical protein ES19_0081 [Escherichia phage ES19]ANN86677.1 hypothetical protein [Shigella phage SHFML-11]ANN86871.1 hypothetical protein [Shigella phage SHFML-26]
MFDKEFMKLTKAADVVLFEAEKAYDLLSTNAPVEGSKTLK